MAKKKDAEPTAEAAAVPAEKITKTEAVKRAIAAGKDQPKAATEWIKEQFDLDMTSQQFSTAKFQQKKAEGTPAKKPGRPSANGAVSHSVAKVVVATTTTNPAELAQAVKALVKQHGVEAIKQMADVFAD